MPHFALLVDLSVHPGRGDDFAPLIEKAAAAAVANEADCHQFHVGRDQADPDRFVLFEVYENAGSLDQHHKEPHYLEFIASAGELIAKKTGTPLDLA